MPLIFVPRYRARIHSSSTDDLWEIQVKRSFVDPREDRSVALTDSDYPSWADAASKRRYVDLEQPQGESGKLTYVKEYEIYQPILGSKFEFSFLSTETVPEFDDLNFGTEYEYAVDVRYFIDKESYRLNSNVSADDSNSRLFWRGFILPVDSREHVMFRPFPLKFTASDRLNALENLKMPPTYDTFTRIFRLNASTIRLIDIIKYAIRQTGTELPIYVNSGVFQIASTSPTTTVVDGLINATVQRYAFNDRNVKDVVNGILSAFNCRLIQSNGKWYCFNLSLLNDDADWYVYEWDDDEGYYNDDPNSTLVNERLGFELNSDLGQTDFHVVDKDIEQFTRLSVGSVECQPQELSQVYFISNFDFSEYIPRDLDDPTSVDVFPDWDSGFSSDSRYSAVRDYPKLSTNPDEYLTGRGAVYTDIGSFDVDDASDRWLLGSSDLPVDVTTPISVSIDFMVKDISSRILNVRLIFGITLSVLNPADAQNNQPYTVYYRWNFVDQRWARAPSLYASDSNNTAPDSEELRFYEIGSSGQNYFRTVNETLDTGVASDQFQRRVTFDVDAVNGFYIYILSPTCRRSSGGQVRNLSDSTENVFNTSRHRGNFKLFIDSIKIRNEFDDRILNPTYERVQSRYTRTQTYEPYVGTLFHNSIAQKIIAIDGVDDDAKLAYQRYRKDNQGDLILDDRAPAQGTARVDRSLEDVVTQLKLNDFRYRFQTFELCMMRNILKFMGEVNRTTSTVSVGVNLNLSNASGFLSRLRTGDLILIRNRSRHSNFIYKRVDSVFIEAGGLRRRRIILDSEVSSAEVARLSIRSDGLLSNQFIDAFLVNEPYHAIHKLKINYQLSNFVSGYSTDGDAMVFGGGDFDLRMGKWTVMFFSNNQVTVDDDTGTADIANMNRFEVDDDDWNNETGQIKPGFYIQNINLIAPLFRGREDLEEADTAATLFRIDNTESKMNMAGKPTADTTNILNINITEIDGAWLMDLFAFYPNTQDFGTRITEDSVTRVLITDGLHARNGSYSVVAEPVALVTNGTSYDCATVSFGVSFNTVRGGSQDVSIVLTFHEVVMTLLDRPSTYPTSENWNLNVVNHLIQNHVNRIDYTLEWYSRNPDVNFDAEYNSRLDRPLNVYRNDVDDDPLSILSIRQCNEGVIRATSSYNDLVSSLAQSVPYRTWTVEVIASQDIVCYEITLNNGLTATWQYIAENRNFNDVQTISRDMETDDLDPIQFNAERGTATVISGDATIRECDELQVNEPPPSVPVVTIGPPDALTVSSQGTFGQANVDNNFTYVISGIDQPTDHDIESVEVLDEGGRIISYSRGVVFFSIDESTIARTIRFRVTAERDGQSGQAVFTVTQQGPV